MDDKRFRLGFWDVVIQKEIWVAIKAFIIIAIVGLLCFAGVFVAQQSKNKAVAKEKEIETNVSQFIKDYSTLDVNEDTMSSLYEQGKQIAREDEKSNQDADATKKDSKSSAQQNEKNNKQEQKNDKHNK